MLAAFFDVSCRAVTPSRRSQRGFRLQAVVQTLGVDGYASESLYRETASGGDRDFPAGQRVARQVAGGCGGSVRFAIPHQPRRRGQQHQGTGHHAACHGVSISHGACVRQINAPQPAVTVL